MSLSSQPQTDAWFPEDAKWAFTTRRVNRAHVAGISDRLSNAISGDLVLAKITTIGHHQRIQLAEGRNSEAYVDDFSVLCCGDRYAPDQIEGVGALTNSGCDLLAAVGLIGQMRKSNSRMAEPTRLRPFGLLERTWHQTSRKKRAIHEGAPQEGACPNTSCRLRHETITTDYGRGLLSADRQASCADAW